MGDRPAVEGRGRVLALLALLAIGAAVCSGLLVSSSPATAAAGLPAGNAAIVVGKPITVHTFDHWMYVAAQGQASESPHAPVIVPTDPLALIASPEAGASPPEVTLSGASGVGVAVGRASRRAAMGPGSKDPGCAGGVAGLNENVEGPGREPAGIVVWFAGVLRRHAVDESVVSTVNFCRLGR